ncbi:MAG: peptidylprolyl isomerase [Flavobacteriaceae bacterium]|nr:peptidylprolyl isomerase [Flavobacteriaceae bacterium]
MIVFKVFYSSNYQKFLFLVFIIAFSQFTIAQKSSKAVLLTIDKHPISVEEFEQVYKKNNDVIVDKSQQEINTYLDLFINFKLKLIDARQMGLDTLKSYQSELSKYRDQLAEPFLKDEQTVELLVKEAYKRLERDVSASHILIQLSLTSSPTDTLAAFNTIIEALNKILQGASFEAVATEYSQDPSVTENGGNLGYFTAFNMVYPFETACFNTNIGEISNPFRTRFGYHIVKVNDNRPTKGEIEVAHIMLKNTDEESKINEIYQRLIKGESFETLAKQFSVDQNSAQNGGKMTKFRAGRLVKEFEDVAFNLKEGEFSKPFKTVYGWHILKLLKKYPLQTFQEMEAELKNKVQNDQRSEIITKSLAKKLKQTCQFRENQSVSSKISEIYSIPSEEILFSINQKNIFVKQFQEYLNANRNENIYDNYNDFKDFQLIEYHKNNLENENSAFAAVMKEYEEGLLLFEILQRKIWDQSEIDTLGLKSFYHQHQHNYNWEKRVEGTVISCQNEATAKSIIQYLNEGNSIENIKKVFTKNSEIIEIKSGIFEQESLHLPKSFDFIEGISKIYHDNGKMKLVVVDTILNPSPKTFDESKGKLMNDYQQYLDQQWITELRRKFKVNINKKELNKLINKYQ